MANSLELIFAEFGRPRPDVEKFLRWFPGATARVITESNIAFNGPRAGWRLNDYWKARGLWETKAEVAIAFDSDMEIVSQDVQTLPILADRFGLCLPANPRWLVRTDTLIGADSDKILDSSNGTGFAMNCSPIAFCRGANFVAVEVVEQCWRILRAHPIRGPLAWWRAAWQARFCPCILPPQWCVCQEHIGIGNEIILHVGHEKVKEFYGTQMCIPRD